MMTGTKPPYVKLLGEYSEETFSISGNYPGDDDSGKNTPFALNKLIAKMWGLSAPSFGDDVTIAEFSLKVEPRRRRFEFTANDVV
ncbi:MAG: hypothetical protein K8I82_08420, partial [Anaerolineae bacterium]|nr:hypothetical protein [Anaerolineae bacterium]